MHLNAVCMALPGDVSLKGAPLELLSSIKRQYTFWKLFVASQIQSLKTQLYTFDMETLSPKFY